jgi:hypothetical protein
VTTLLGYHVDVALAHLVRYLPQLSLGKGSQVRRTVDSIQ